MTPETRSTRRGTVAQALRANERERALEVAARLSAMGPIMVIRFFGGAGLSKDNVQFGFVMKGTLFLRVDDWNRPHFEALNASPFFYGSRARTVRVASYYEVPDEVADEPLLLLRWAEQAHRAALTAKTSSGHKRRKRRTPKTAAEIDNLRRREDGNA